MVRLGAFDRRNPSKGKTPPKNLRRTISAIFWRHQNGAKWRALPSEFGPWWIAVRLFIRWSKLGVWQRLFEKVRGADPELGMVFLDGTTIRAHHKAAGAAKKGDTEDASGIVRRLAAHVEALAPRSA